MSTWNIDFISKRDFKRHVEATIVQYRDGIMPYDLAKFNSNTIDPIKLMLDQAVYGKSWDEIVEREVIRQRDKGSNNGIGYFHQNIFKYIKDCTVPDAGWDVIYKPKGRADVASGIQPKRVYVEMKNKHNTMNSASAGRTYTKMQEQLLRDDDCACLLVEAIAKRSQNVPWEVSIDGHKKSHKLIRRVSMDKFYEIVTGDPLGFHKVCTHLSETIQEVLAGMREKPEPKDTVMGELQIDARQHGGSITYALMQLGFSTYEGFEDD